MQLSYQMLILLPFLVVGALTGVRRGWRREAFTTFGLLLTLVFFGTQQRTGVLGELFNRLVQAFGWFFSTLLGTDFQTFPVVDPNNPSVFQIIGFIVFFILSYAMGNSFGDGKNVSRLGALAGGILGIVNVFLVGSQVFSFIYQYRPSAFGDQSVIILTPGDGTADTLRNYLPTIFAVLFIFLLLYMLFRLPKTRQ
jgi:hypothetical protein